MDNGEGYISICALYWSMMTHKYDFMEYFFLIQYNGWKSIVLVQLKCPSKPYRIPPPISRRYITIEEKSLSYCLHWCHSWHSYLNPLYSLVPTHAKWRLISRHYKRSVWDYTGQCRKRQTQRIPNTLPGGKICDLVISGSSSKINFNIYDYVDYYSFIIKYIEYYIENNVKYNCLSMLRSYVRYERFDSFILLCWTKYSYEFYYRSFFIPKECYISLNSKCKSLMEI